MNDVFSRPAYLKPLYNIDVIRIDQKHLNKFPAFGYTITRTCDGEVKRFHSIPYPDEDICLRSCVDALKLMVNGWTFSFHYEIEAIAQAIKDLSARYNKELRL